jgi:UDP-2,3-diacylglucosamine pyrophosphatase LpxH
MGASGPKHRTLFLSDLHLGAIGSRSDHILQFLHENDAEAYVLVGDILDLWHPLLPHWSEDDQRVLNHLRDRQAKGAQVRYLRGNHDPDPSRAPASKRLEADVVDELVHVAKDGRRYLVLHGDVADGRAVRSHMMTRLGSRIDHLLRRLDGGLSVLRRRSVPEARSMIEALLSGVNAILYRSRAHERRLITMAKSRGLDGVICGHFHIASLHEDHGLIYANCGDWVDSLTAIVEADDGGLQLLAWCPEIAASAQKTRTMGLEDAA